MNQQEILQLRAYKDLEDFAIHANELDNDWDKFSEFMIDDVHRELLQYVEGPKPSESLLPETDYIQLRHIDVPPKLIQKYRRNVNRP